LETLTGDLKLDIKEGCSVQPVKFPGLTSLDDVLAFTVGTPFALELGSPTNSRLATAQLVKLEAKVRSPNRRRCLSASTMG
jgi:hypothetical protein